MRRNLLMAVADTGFDIGEIGPKMHHGFWDTVAGRFSSRVLEIIDYVPPYTELSHNPDDQQGHGTHVSVTMLGSGYLSGSVPEKDFYDGSFAGMAPRARLLFGSFGLDDPWSSGLYISGSGELYYSFYVRTGFPDRGARILSNSWGCIAYSCPDSPYKWSSKDTDKYMNHHKGFLVVFSAGNYGTYNSVKPPGNAKNTLCIGAAIDDRTVAYFSSKGPTDDGRVKPDLIAPGTGIVSTRSQVAHSSCAGKYQRNENYSYCSGTSMAAPATSGVAALVRQYCQKWEDHNPSAALVKATLINGARDIDAYGFPSDEAGWGFLDIENALPTSGTTLTFSDREHLWTGEERELRILVKPYAPLNVTLVWTDYPGEIEADRTLVSDLDLIVVDPDQRVLVGNDVSALGKRVSVRPASEPQPPPHHDRTNNVERVIVLYPVAGEYRIIVSAHNTPMGEQDFALVCTYCPPE